jgi:basic secretory peptidase family protein/F5/8 type C domain-containing protein
MTRAFLVCLLVPLLLPAADPPKKPVAAVVESSLKSAGGNIRQFAFDGDPDTYFASDGNPGKDDHFTLRFDEPVKVKKATVITGRPKGGDELTTGVLESSEDGERFVELSLFKDGTASGPLPGKTRAIRIKPGELKHPLVVREIKVEADPPIATFRYPVEFTVNVTDAPEMKEWADKTARVCERQYAMINDQLKSDGYKPPTQVTMTLKKDYRGVAATGGSRITGSVKYFHDHPDDIGAMVHETVHIVQHYRARNNPGWLVEGIADYVRFFKYEPGKIGVINPDRARYDGAYRQTAAFLNYVNEKYDKDLVRKLNAAMRQGEYKEDLWKELTKKTAKELDEEWRGTLKK